MNPTRNDYPLMASRAAYTAILENNARRRFGRAKAGTPIGWARARQLANQEPISLTTIRRTNAFLKRARVYNTGDWNDKGTIAYHLWGGDAMLLWTEKILRQ
jgi:hypothetical protein